MKSKTSLPQLTKDDIKVNRIYKAKKPKRVMIGFSDFWNDRQILYVSPNKSHMETTFIDYTPEYKEWIKHESLHSLGSEYSQIAFENDHPDKSAKINETKWDYSVQYDSPSVRNGKNYPMMSMSKFLEWAGEDVTDITPKGDWRQWEREPLKQKSIKEKQLAK